MSNTLNAVGIVAEYNPFHNGHKWHVEQAKKLSGQKFAIAVMSGNFVQRGEPAIFNKWERAKMAVLSGVDLVIELPAIFAVRSAQYFATGSVRLLNELGIISHLCFGAETDDLTILKKAAQEISNHETILHLKTKLKTGTTYAAALGYALGINAQIDSSLLKSPNNILAIEYLREINNLKSKIVPISVKRHIAQHNDIAIKDTFASAGAIRKILTDQTDIKSFEHALPNFSANAINKLLIQQQGPATIQAFSPIILGKLRTATLKSLEQTPDVSEGLHNLIKESALKARTLEELFVLLKSKRYTRTRLQRIMIHILLGTHKKQLSFFDQTGPLFARVLAFNDNGRKLLKSISDNSPFPIITKTSQFLTSKQRDHEQLTPLQEMLAIDTIASDLFSLASPSSQWHAGGQDFLLSPIYIPHPNCE